MNVNFTLLTFVLGLLLLAVPARGAGDGGTVVTWGGMISPYVESGTRYLKIAAGGLHTVALKNDGTVVAWGNNYYDQTAVPAGLTGVTAIAAGGDHTVALKNDGTVVAWGYNYFGTTNVPTGLSGVTAIAAGGGHTVALKNDGTVVAWGDYRFDQTTVPAGLSGVTAIAAGSLHTVALKNDGTIVAWGNNSSGQTTVPTGLSGVTAIAAGGSHTVALKNDGTVVAWGGNTYGQTTVPTGLSGVTTIAASYDHTVALKNDGTIVAWGGNTYGQTMVPAGLSNATAIAAGYDHTVALKNDGTVIAWGYNSSGQATVPTGLSGVTAIAGGGLHTVALKNDGTVIAWGYNYFGTTNVPAGLTGVTAIAAGGGHNVVLKNDGTVVAWGNNSSGQTTVPTGLSGVTAIAAGCRNSHTVALKSNGTVVAWGWNAYGQTTVPTGLSGVTAIAAGALHTVALKNDGTVIAWGNNDYGQSAVPSGLTGVTAIAAGELHTVALKNDGTVVAWGWNIYGQAAVPAGLTRVTAIAAGTFHTVALVVAASPAAPVVATPPADQTVRAGQSASFTVSVTGTAPFTIQWLFNGVAITSATSATLTLNNVQPGNAGRYSVRVSNSIGSATSQAATLAVLADPANGTPPAARTYPVVPAKLGGKDSLVVVTHGWQPLGAIADALNFTAWVDDMANTIRIRSAANWQVWTNKWIVDASTPLPDMALVNAISLGRKLGRDIAGQGWSHVHLIGHSAGAMLIQQACEAIKETTPATTVHTTFLDPYTGLNDFGRDYYGILADWSDSYFAHDVLTSAGFSSRTEGALVQAFNVDVTWLDPDRRLNEVYASSPSSTTLAMLTPIAYQATSSHFWPYGFYQATVTNGLSGTEGLGFPLSKEGGGWDNRGSYQRGQTPRVLGAMPSLPRNIFPVQSNPKLLIDLLPIATSGSVQVSGSGFSLLTGSSAPLPQALGPVAQALLPASTGTPVWLSIGVVVTNQVNFVSFDGQFTSGTGAAGLLTVYWNTNQIGVVDEGVAAAGTRNYTFALPGVFDPGNYTLGFRLDPFSATTSSVAVTNVVTGFSGLTNAMTMSLTPAGTNATPSLRVTGPSGYNYLVEATTNFVTWEPVATLVNSNGAVDFVDTRTTNFIRRFYRAVLP